MARDDYRTGARVTSVVTLDRPKSRVRALPVLAVAALLLVAVGAYALPRLGALAAVPARLDIGLAAASRYNPGLDRVAQLEESTAASLGGLETISASLGRLRTSVVGLSPVMAAMVAGIEKDLTSTLALTVSETASLQASLRRLEGELGVLAPSFTRSSAAIDEARRVVDTLLAALTSTAAEVRRATVAANGAAANVVGPARP